MAINNQRKIIIFETGGDKDENKIIREILKNNGLEETSIDYFKKARSGEEPWFKSLYILSKDLAAGNITEKNFVSSLQSQIQISQQVAKNILKEIKEKLLPLVRTLDKDELEKESMDNTSMRQLVQPINVFNTTEKKIQTIENKTTDITIAPPQKQPRIKKPIISGEIKKSAPQLRQSKEPDKYREPVE